MRDRRNTIIKIADARGTLREACSPLGADIHFNHYSILPGFTDVHVHLREPGFSYKETISAGTRAAAAGGFTTVLTMPNLDPVPDSPDHLRVQTKIIEQDACIDVRPLGSLTRGERGEALSDIEALAPLVAAFSDDGVGVMDDGIMREAMVRVRDAGSIVVAHCEDTRYPRESREAEYRQLERDLLLAEETGCPYHMCHVSTKESLQLIRQARRAGLDVTCETAPHYLTLCSTDLTDDGRFKMNPPIKEASDREALLEAVCDGTIDMIATDHAPHSAEEKGRGFAGSAYGIVGLETAFPVLYTRLVREGILPLQKLVSLLTDAPGRRFGIPAPEIEEQAVITGGRKTPEGPGPASGRIQPPESNPGAGNETAANLEISHKKRLAPGTSKPDMSTAEATSDGAAPLTFSVWDLDTPYRVEPERFRSMGRSTPFAGWEVYGRCMMTVYKGKVVYLR